MTRRSYKKPHRAKRKKPLYAKAAFWRLVLGCFVILGGIWLVCFAPVLEVKEINVSGSEKINNQDCAKIIEQEVAKKIALFESKSILLFNLDRVKKEILAKYPQIQDIKIEREFPSKIFASLQERRGVAFLNNNNDKFYLIDGDGIAFEECAQQTDLIEITNDRQQEVNLGSQVIPKDLLSTILKIKGEMQSSMQINVLMVDIATAERLNFQTSDGWFVYFNPLKDTGTQLTKLAAVLGDETFKTKKANLEYIDVRFTRVYLKEKQ